MKMIDTALPEFIASMLLDFFSKSRKTVADLAGALSENQHITSKYGLSLTNYEYKIKNFLDAVALGMVPSKPWDGFAKAHTVTPLGRSSTPDDIAATVCFIVESPAITGTTLLVDGGQHLLPLQRDVMFIAK